MMILPIGKNSFVVRRASCVVRKRNTQPVLRSLGEGGYAIRNTKNGFTLIEIMISLAILSIGLVSILQGFIHCLNYLRISDDNFKASLMAENKMVEAQIQAKEDWDSFKKGLNKRFKFEGLKCIWDIEVKQAAWDMEEIPQSYESLFEVRAAFTWEEGKRKGMVPVFTYMRSHDEAG